MNARLHIFKFGWKNIWRNKRRTTITLFAIAFGVMSIVFIKSYLLGLIDSSKQDMIKTRIGHIKIAHKKFLRLERIMPKEHMIPNLNQIQDDLSQLTGIEAACERIKFHVLLNRRDINEPAMAFGIDPGKADKTMDLSQAIVEGNYYDDSGLNLIIGKQLAKKLDITINDELLLVTTDINYSTYALPFRVAGIFHTGYVSMDKHMVFIPLKKASEMLDCGDRVHEILFFLKKPHQAVEFSEKIKTLLSGTDPGKSIKVIPWQTDDYIKSFIPFIEEMVGKVESIFFILVGLIILNTMLMAVMERYHEIGIIKALGFRNGEVRLLIFVEALFIGTIGSLIGGILGGSLAAVTEKTGIDIAKMVGEGVLENIEVPFALAGNLVYPDLTVEILIGSIIFGIIIALAAVLYPAVKSAKMSPVEAFHSELKV